MKLKTFESLNKKDYIQDYIVIDIQYGVPNKVYNLVKEIAKHQLRHNYSFINKT